MIALAVIGLIFSPRLSEPPAEYSPGEIAAIEKNREVDFDPDPESLPTVYREVDYREGSAADWYPKNESPILADLVREGKLPPLGERMPQEPVVLEGVEGIGTYGGTWLRLALSTNDIGGVLRGRISYATAVRWSPLGYPLVPHVAREVIASSDKREYVMVLRRGMKWSDGHPLTADDIMYWWRYHIHDDNVRGGVVPAWLLVGGKPPTFEKIDDLRVRITFPIPNGLFPERLASSGAQLMFETPSHYLGRYHPTIGDSALIRKLMAHYRLPSPRSIYGFMRNWLNPECPRLWPWTLRAYKTSPPLMFERNPYYFAVDPRGNQLPYIDRIQFEVQDGRMIPISAANGLVSMQTRHLRFKDYTQLMNRRENGGYRVLHWYSGTRSEYVINPNMNRRTDPRSPDLAKKAALLKNKKFRRALSLAIDRETIIRAEYNNLGHPSQIEPGAGSPFHHPGLANAYIAHDPDSARRILDRLGLDKRDIDGFRLFPDGSRMVFYVEFCAFTGIGPLQFIVDDWGAVGLRVIPRERSRIYFFVRNNAGNFDFNVWSSESDYMPLIGARYFLAYSRDSFFANRWGRWYSRGGYYDAPNATAANSFPPPEGHPMWDAYEAFDAALRAPVLEEQVAHFNRVCDIAADNLWSISIATPPPQIVVVKNEMRNVPSNAVCGYIFNTPGNTGVETYYLDKNNDSPGTIEKSRHDILNPTPRPGITKTFNRAQTSGDIAGKLITFLIAGSILAGLVLVALKHPYVAHRLIVMIPTMLVISVAVFCIIQLPPGDFLTSRIIELEESGDPQDLQTIKDLKELFHYDDPSWKLYLRWMGFFWFTSFDEEDKGLLQGNMGRSMQTTHVVNSMVGDRILLTFLISLGTILFTWALAIPIGIYSAVRQYSIGDYLLTFIGFIGMCMPGFLLALILMVLSNVSGLFSAEYATQTEWSWGKVVDLLKHIWLPITVMGVNGTAHMIRIMRANLLDELRKPYVITAMAKGVRPIKLLFKYPVRMALNPFVSGIGGLFPHLISGGAIVGMVLSLPTVGPLMLDALFAEDMYLAGSMLLVLSMLGVFGTLVSDLMLLWLDPRIRFKGGTR